MTGEKSDKLKAVCADPPGRFFMEYYVVKLRFSDGQVRQFRVKNAPGHLYEYNEYVPNVIPFAHIVASADVPPREETIKKKTTLFYLEREGHHGNWHYYDYREK